MADVGLVVGLEVLDDGFVVGIEVLDDGFVVPVPEGSEVLQVWCRF